MNFLSKMSRRKPYFEGWYLKHQSKEYTIAFIPAFHLEEPGNESASIQVITNSGSHKFLFPASSLSVCKEWFHVTIDQNIFSKEGITIDLKGDGLTVSGQLRYGPFTPLRYDIMGPFHLLPFMQCNHGVLSLQHTIQGSLTINKQTVDFHDSKGYIEKDWGTSFPLSYLWTQCNCFDGQDCSIMASVAHIPLGGLSFTGCICCVYYQGSEYRLATYLGANILQHDESKVVLQQGKYLLKATLLEENPHSLLAPDTGRMSRTIHQSAACTVRYQFYIDNKKLFDLVSRQASFEYSNEKETSYA